MHSFNSRCAQYKTRNRAGVTLVLMVFLFVVIIGMTAFAVDLGIMYLDRVQIQNAVDAGAIAAILGAPIAVAAGGVVVISNGIRIAKNMLSIGVNQDNKIDG